MFHSKPSNKERSVMRTNAECFVSPQFSCTPLGGNIYMVENARTATERLELFSLAVHYTQSATPKSGRMKTDAGWKCHKCISNCQRINLLTHSALLPWDLYWTPLIKNTSRLGDMRVREKNRVSKQDLFNSPCCQRKETERRGWTYFRKKEKRWGWNKILTLFSLLVLKLSDISPKSKKYINK